MIKVMIKQAAEKRGINTPAELARRVKVQERVAGRWWKATDMDGVLPGLRSLDAICAAFGNCDLGELIKRVPDKRKRGTNSG